MRRTPWMLLLPLFACAGGVQPAEPAAAPPPTPGVIGQPASTQAPPACDASVAPQVIVYDTGNCPGIMPEAPSCAAKVAACSGVTGSSLGPRGTIASAATGDATGALAIACSNVDAGPSPGFAFFAQTSSGYAKRSHLGDSAIAAPAGFVASQSSVNGRPAPDLLFFDSTGQETASVSQTRGTAFVGPAAVEVASVVSGSLVVQQYSFDGKPRGAPQTAGPATADAVLDGATDDLGHTLVIWGSYGDAVASARWFAPDGTPETAAFQLEGAVANIGRSAALPGGGIAIGGSVGPRWRKVITAGSTIPAPAPAWLAAQDGSFVTVRGGRAMAFGDQIIAPDGTSCGTLDFANAALIGIARDGTAMATVDGASVLVYPKFLE